MTPAVSVVLVTYRSAGTLTPVLRALRRELGPEDEVIVVDNASGDGTLALVERELPAARRLPQRANTGFPAACNAGAAVATGDVLVFLNPDATPHAGWGDAIRAPAVGGRWAAWQALVTTDDGRVVNTDGNVVHFTGLGWTGNAGEPVRVAAAGDAEVAYCSGACLAVRREWFARVGGFAGAYFLYHEDLDLSLRLRLAGGRLGVAPGARVEHDYAFEKGGYKWRLMERNRWATLVRAWPAGLLVATLPALAATELAIWAFALKGGWGREKAAATVDGLRSLPRWLRERRAIERAIAPAEFARWLTPDLSSRELGDVAANAVVRAGLRAYWRLAVLAAGAHVPR